MGEYAKFAGRDVKIGTCENMYYLRAGQRFNVKAVEGNVDPAHDTRAIRFRFPWPDEDGVQPGGFENYDRGVCLHGMTIPAEVEHCDVQFVAQAGYNVCLPCPESLPEGGRGIEFAGRVIHRNGYRGRVLLCQQRYLPDGRLVPVFRCGGCGARWRLEEPAEIEAAVALARQEADKQSGASRDWWNKVADRMAGRAA